MTITKPLFIHGNYGLPIFNTGNVLFSIRELGADNSLLAVSHPVRGVSREEQEADIHEGRKRVQQFVDLANAGLASQIPEASKGASRGPQFAYCMDAGVPYRLSFLQDDYTDHGQMQIGIIGYEPAEISVPLPGAALRCNLMEGHNEKDSVAVQFVELQVAPGSSRVTRAVVTNPLYRKNYGRYADR